MGQVGAAQAIAERQPTIDEFIHLCTEIDISQHPQAQAWGLNLLQDADFQDRWRLAKVFHRLGKEAIAPLLELAENPQVDTELRWFAIRILGQYEDAQAIARLILLLDHCEEDFLSEEIMRALVQLQETATDYLLPLLEQEDTRLLAVKALCKIRYPNIVDPLLSVVQDAHVEVRALAIEALSSFRHPNIFGVLLAALRDPASPVRLEAVIGLGFWAGCTDQDLLLEKIKPLLYDVNLDICRQAAFTLSRLQSSAAAKAIAKVLQSPNTPLSLQIDLLQALGWMDVPESLEYLAQTLATTTETMGLETLKVMGRITEHHRKIQGTEILLKFWRGNPAATTPQFRKTFAYALGQLQNPQAYELLSAFAQDPDESVKLHAIAALKKIIP